MYLLIGAVDKNPSQKEMPESKNIVAMVCYRLLLSK
jgi:hypothetical protein